MSDSSLSQTFANLAAPPKIGRVDPTFLNANTAPRRVISGIAIQQAYGDVLSQLHTKAGLPDHLPVSLLTRTDLELIYAKPLPPSYTSITDLEERRLLVDTLIDYYKEQGITIKKTPDSLRKIEDVLKDVIQGEATSQMPTVDIPMCIISFDADEGKLFLKDSFLGVAGISDPEDRIKIDPNRLEDKFTLIHEAAHCKQTGLEKIGEAFQAEREADLIAHKAAPAEAQLFYRARLIYGIHKSAVRSLLDSENPDFLDHATEIDLIDPKKFPVISPQDQMAAYQEIGRALTQERLLIGAFDTPTVRQRLPSFIDLAIRDSKDTTLKGQLSTLKTQLQTTDKPFSDLYKESLSYNLVHPSPLKNTLLYLALEADKKSPFMDQDPITTLADTAPLVANLLSKPDIDRLSPLAQDLLILYTQASADVQPDLEAYRHPLPANTRNPFTQDISAFMIHPPPTQHAVATHQKPVSKKAAKKKSPQAP